MFRQSNYFEHLWLTIFLRNWYTAEVNIFTDSIIEVEHSGNTQFCDHQIESKIIFIWNNHKQNHFPTQRSVFSSDSFP